MLDERIVKWLHQFKKNNSGFVKPRGISIDAPSEVFQSSTKYTEYALNYTKEHNPWKLGDQDIERALAGLDFKDHHLRSAVKSSLKVLVPYEPFDNLIVEGIIDVYGFAANKTQNAVGYKRGEYDPSGIGKCLGSFTAYGVLMRIMVRGSSIYYFEDKIIELGIDWWETGNRCIKSIFSSGRGLGFL